MAQIKELKRAYGFDDVAIAPGEITVNPEGVNTTFALDGHEFAIPFLASAMDAVVNPSFAGELHRLGGLAVETATIMMVYIDLRVRETSPATKRATQRSGL